MASVGPASRLLVGTAGWSYADWEGPVYPRPRPRAFHPLGFLAAFVDVVEINTTFYALPPPSMAARWAGIVADRPGFRFFAKVPQALTHGAWPGDRAARELGDAFAAALAPLADAGRLAGSLVQLPASFRRTPAARARLEQVRARLRGGPVVVELRHRSWFDRAGLADVAALDVSLAHVDLPAARDHPPARHPSLGPVGYVRLHGRNAAAWFDRRAGRDQRYDWLYDRAALEEVAARVRAVRAETDLAVVIANNHYRGQALANALELDAILRERTPRAPAALVEAYPHLRGRVEVAGQATLF